MDTHRTVDTPHEIRTTDEFVALLRTLKERSRMTFRQLEQRADEHGDVLARSTLANVLRQGTVPREETLTAFVRACGDEHRLDAWLDARNRILHGSIPQDDTAPDAPLVVPPARTVRRRPGPRLLLIVAAVLLALGAGAWTLVPDASSDRAPASGSRSEGSGSAGSGPDGRGGLTPGECTEVLQKGAHGRCVQKLQERLRQHGLALPADAFFGPFTKMRLTAFQVFAYLPPTAMTDDPTRKALYADRPRIEPWSADRVDLRVRQVFPEDPEAAVGRVRCLSQLDPLWIWGNPDGSRRWGLFQFSDLELLELRSEPAAALDAEWSIQQGRAIWERTRTFDHWPCTPRVAPEPAPPAR